MSVIIVSTYSLYIRQINDFWFWFWLGSQVTCWNPEWLSWWLGLEISWFALTSLFVFCIFWNSYMWHHMLCFIIYVQKAVSILFIDKLCVQCHHRENMLSAKLLRLRITSQGDWSNFSSTPIWLGYLQLGCYQCHQTAIEGDVNFWSDKNSINQINYVHINIFHKKGNWFKIWKEFLRPMLAKIELICQQPAMPQLSGVQGVASQPWGAV